MKIIKRVAVISAVFLCLTFYFLMAQTKTVFAAESGQAGDLTWKLNGEGTLTISGIGAMKDYTAGSAPWYANRDSIIALVIEDGVTNIGAFAFYNCQNLITVSVTDDLVMVGNNAFKNCVELKKATFDSIDTVFGKDVFAGCSKLAVFGDPASDACIYAMKNDIPINIEFECTVIREGTCGLWRFSQETGESTFYPDFTWKIYEGGLLFITGEGSSWGKSYNDDDSYRDPDWDSCYVKEVIIKEGLKSIGPDAFAAFDISVIKIPESVTNIGHGAIRDEQYWNRPQEYGPLTMYGLNGSAAREMAISLREKYDNITFLPIGTAISWEFADGVLTFSGDGQIIYDASWSKYRENITTIEIKNGITCIGNNMFRGCRNLKTVSLPSTIESIGDNAFYECKSLESINLPSGLLSIGDDAFEACIKLTNITLPDGLTSLGKNAFNSCGIKEIVIPGKVKQLKEGTFAYSSLQRITMEMGVVSIDKRVFECCESLKEVILPKGLTSIGECAFDECYLQEITLPEGMTHIGARAFLGCRLKKVNIPKSVTRIEQSAFALTDITRITIPEGIKEIGESAFCSCLNLTSVTLPSTLTKIESYAFLDCPALKKIVVPKNVTKIGEHAFAACPNLSSVTLPSTLIRIERGAFCDCPTLKKIVVPQNVTKIGEAAFLNVKQAAILSKDVSINAKAFSEGVVLYGYKGSTAETYASKHSFTFNPLVSITKQPVNTYAIIGKTATLKVTAASFGSCTYQWYYRTSSTGKWNAVSAASGKTSSYNFTVASRHDGYQYRCKITDSKLGISIYSKIVKLTIVRAKPSITTQPKAVSAAVKQRATLRIVANGTGLSYQWQYRKPGGTWTNVLAAAGKKATYSFTATKAKNGYQYRCKVTNLKGSVTSRAVKLSVK